MRTNTITQRHRQLAIPPVIIAGGDSNALSIAWSLGRAGVEIYAINAPEALVKYSRFCKWIEIARGSGTVQEDLTAYLLGSESEHLRGSVLLAASDVVIELIATHRQQLSKKFRLDLSNPAAQLGMLNKLCTYRAARAVGVPTPKFWVADTREQIGNLKDDLVFPLILKPILSHEFKDKFNGAPFVQARRFDELLDAFDAVSNAGIETFLVEVIPGPDDKLCSYYTYLDESGQNLFDYTKRIIRRFPVNMGAGVYHITDNVADIKELSLKLFRHVGLRGIANAEFKLDERDNQLKLIECNARFTAADCLLTASGLNLSLFVYNRLTGRPQQVPETYRLGLRLWHPLRDYMAYRQLNKMGLLTFRHWVRSVLHPQIFPIFRWYDPLPAIINVVWRARRLFGRIRIPRFTGLRLRGKASGIREDVHLAEEINSEGRRQT